MTTITNTLHSMSDSNAAVVELPEHVYGFIDLSILADIHRYLAESEMEDDILLARWVLENYLFESTGQVGGTIRTTEEFSQLDRAYRRVRSLTNKAQDKWPFFDKNWKEMSSITVRNNARGEIAPGITFRSLPTAKNEANIVPAIGDVPKPKSSPVSHVQAPAETGQAARSYTDSPHLAHDKSALLPSSSLDVEKDLGPLMSSAEPTPRKKLQQEQGAGKLKLADEESSSALSTSTDHASESQNQDKNHLDLVNKNEANATTEAIPSKSPIRVTTINQINGDTELLSESAQSPTDSKVRGPNGRYLSKPDSPLIPKKVRRKSAGLFTRKKTKSNIRKANKTPALRRGEHKATLDQVSRELSTPITGDNTHSDLQSPSLAIDQHASQNELDDEVVPVLEPVVPSQVDAHGVNGLNESTGGEPKNDVLQDDSISNGSPTSQTLAVEAEAVASNLDRLPPGRSPRSTTRPIKRKRDSAAEVGERKRGRHGGIVGRPRKSDPRVVQSGMDANEDVAEKREPSVADGSRATTEDTPQRMVTRRVTRRSAAPTVRTSSPDGHGVAHELDGKQIELNGDGVAPPPRTDVETKVGSTENENPGSEGHEDQKGSLTGSKAARSRIVKLPVSQAQTPATDALAVELGTTNTSPRRSKSKPGRRVSTKVQKPGANAANVKQKTRSLKSAAKTAEPAEATPVQASDQQDSSLATQEPTPSQVEYLARIHTCTGPVDVPVAVENIDAAEHESIRKYAEWMATEGGTFIPYQQFRSIFGFAKKDSA